MRFHYKTLEFRNIGGEKSRIDQDKPGLLVLSHGTKSWGSPKGLEVPHPGMAVTTPWNCGHPAAPLGSSCALKPPGNPGAAASPRAEIPGVEQPPEQPQTLTLHLSHLSCQSGALAPPGASLKM